MVHARDCPVAKNRLNKDAERFITVEWSDEPVRSFETGVVVTAKNGKGVLAQVAAALAATEADIVHIDMGQEAMQDDVEFRFVIAVRDVAHLTAALRNLNRSPSVMLAERRKVSSPG